MLYVQLPVLDAKPWPETSACIGVYIKGAAAAELVGMVQCFAELDARKDSWGTAVVYSDSDNVVNYVLGKNPVSPDGHCLYPLVYLTRWWVARLKASGKEVYVEWIPRRFNLCHALALRSLRFRSRMSDVRHPWGRENDHGVLELIRTSGLLECIHMVSDFHRRVDSTVQRMGHQFFQETEGCSPPPSMGISRWGLSGVAVWV